MVQVTEGAARRRSTLPLSAEDIAQGYSLACQTVIEGDITVIVPPQEKIERRLTTDRTVGEVVVPVGYDPRFSQTIRRVRLSLQPPSMDDQTDHWGRLQISLRQTAGIGDMSVSLGTLRNIGGR